MVTRANPKVVALAEDRLLKNLGFSSSKLVPPSTMANVTLLVMRANRLPDLSTSSKSGLRGKPTTFVGCVCTAIVQHRRSRLRSFPVVYAFLTSCLSLAAGR